MSADMQAAFPGSTWVDMPLEDRRRWCLGFLRRLWGDHAGFGCLAHGDPYIDTGGKYRHNHFTQRFYAWPTEQTEMASDALKFASYGLDVYIAPMLRAERSRKKGSGAGARFAWADLDGPMTAGRRQVISAMGDAARVVSSGTGHHVYFELDDWHPIDVVEQTNRALVDMLDGDHKWDDTALLRPLGTFNRKPVLRDGIEPALVQVVTP